MTITADEFIRRFLLHVRPRGFHRIRHYGLPAVHPATRTSRETMALSLDAALAATNQQKPGSTPMSVGIKIRYSHDTSPLAKLTDGEVTPFTIGNGHLSTSINLMD